MCFPVEIPPSAGCFDLGIFLGESQDIITPFALAAHSEGLSFRGGKLDDTTVVVGLVPRRW